MRPTKATVLVKGISLTSITHTQHTSLLHHTAVRQWRSQWGTRTRLFAKKKTLAHTPTYTWVMRIVVELSHILNILRKLKEEPLSEFINY